MTVKQKWEAFPYYLKGGIIGASIIFILTFLSVLLNPSARAGSSALIIELPLYSFVGFIIGIFIGFIVGIRKGENKNPNGSIIAGLIISFIFSVICPIIVIISLVDYPELGLLTYILNILSFVVINTLLLIVLRKPLTRKGLLWGYLFSLFIAIISLGIIV